MLLTLFVSFLTTLASAADPTPKHERVWDTKNKLWLEATSLAKVVEPGDILVLGEQHAFEGDQKNLSVLQHQANQVRLLYALNSKVKQEGRKLNVGMEFIHYPFQDVANRWLSGEIDDAAFEKEANWDGGPLFFYKNQMLMPRQSGGQLWALNMVTEVTRQVARYGASTLNEVQRKLLPPIWERGRDEYFNRITPDLAGHVGPEGLENYFMAQSLWDDTMAWNATKRPLGTDSLVIIVGEVHAQFGQGLPARLVRYGHPAAKVKTAVQISLEVWNEENLQRVIAPHETWGEQADYIWVYSVNE